MFLRVIVPFTLDAGIFRRVSRVGVSCALDAWISVHEGLEAWRSCLRSAADVILVARRHRRSIAPSVAAFP